MIVQFECTNNKQDFETKQKYNFTEQKVQKVKEEIHKYLGFEADDFTRVEEGSQHFCSNTCKNHALQYQDTRFLL